MIVVVVVVHTDRMDDGRRKEPTHTHNTWTVSPGPARHLSFGPAKSRRDPGRKQQGPFGPDGGHTIRHRSAKVMRARSGGMPTVLSIWPTPGRVLSRMRLVWAAALRLIKASPSVFVVRRGARTFGWHFGWSYFNTIIVRKGDRRADQTRSKAGNGAVARASRYTAYSCTLFGLACTSRNWNSNMHSAQRGGTPKCGVSMPCIKGSRRPPTVCRFVLAGRTCTLLLNVEYEQACVLADWPVDTGCVTNAFFTLAQRRAHARTHKWRRVPIGPM